jgi:hypothetical protein
MEKKIKAQSLTNQTLNDEFLKIKKTKKIRLKSRCLKAQKYKEDIKEKT